MFRGFLIASFAGAGAANAIPDLTNRSNNPPSYLCLSANAKCAWPKQQASVTAYCSSLLKVPKTTTKTKTTTVCSTTTTTSTATQFTGTANTITSTVSLCATPAAQPTAKKRDVDDRTSNLETRNYGGIPKPACLSRYKESSAITSACSCFNIKPGCTTKTTITSTSTETATATTTTTLPATDTTIFVKGTDLPFAIADYNVRYFAAGGQDKDSEGTGSTRDYFINNDIDNAILFQLNNPSRNLQAIQGETGYAVQYNNEADAEAYGLDSNTRVLIRDQATLDANPSTYSLLTCSISQKPTDLTCPLTCRNVRRAGDVNQAATVNGDVDPWYLGAPGTRSNDVYVTYAVNKVERTAVRDCSQVDCGPGGICEIGPTGSPACVK